MTDCVHPAATIEAVKDKNTMKAYFHCCSLGFMILLFSTVEKKILMQEGLNNLR